MVFLGYPVQVARPLTQFLHCDVLIHVLSKLISHTPIQLWLLITFNTNSTRFVVLFLPMIVQGFVNWVGNIGGGVNSRDVIGVSVQTFF